MTLGADEFIRRFLLHVLPKGFHRIRHYGLLASAGCKANIARARELIAAPMPTVDPPAAHDTADPDADPRRSSPAMPLLRRPHDHRRSLRARRRTARPAAEWSPRQDRDAMTTDVTSSHRPPAGGNRFRCRSSVAAVAAKHPRYAARSRPNRPSRNRRAFAPSASQCVSHGLLHRPAHRSPTPPGRSNRHRRQPSRRPPRVPSLEAFGRRPSVPADRPRLGRHPKPFTEADVPMPTAKRLWRAAVLW